MIFVFVETRGSTLEEVATLFDGEDDMGHLRIIALDKHSAVNEPEVVQVENVESENH